MTISVLGSSNLTIRSLWRSKKDVLAVGSVTDAGTIGLNHVSPDARFQGVNRALLRALEVRAAKRGNRQCNLTSTVTARRFYLSSGYIENGRRWVDLKRARVIR
jgi:hypothetical protein